MIVVYLLVDDWYLEMDWSEKCVVYFVIISLPVGDSCRISGEENLSISVLFLHSTDGGGLLQFRNELSIPIL
jgi:hypothetical protein